MLGLNKNESGSEIADRNFKSETKTFRTEQSSEFNCPIPGLKSCMVYLNNLDLTVVWTKLSWFKKSPGLKNLRLSSPD